MSNGIFRRNIEKNIPSEFMPGKSGTKFVRLYSTYMDFIAITEGEEVKLMPVDDYPALAYTFPPDKKDSRGLYSVSDIMPNLADSVRQSLGIYPIVRINGMGYQGVYSADIRESLNITLEIGNIWGSNADADWWVAMERNGKWYYLDPSLRWVTTQTPIAQSPLRSISDFSLYSGTLPAGTYKVYFGVDLTQDGVANEPLFWDMTTIVVK